MTTAEIYRQLEQSPQMQIARYIFSNKMSDAEYIPLGDVIENIKTGKTPSKLEKRFYEDDFIDWFKPNEIGSQMYLETSEDKLSKFAVEKKQVTIYEPNTILINAIGDIGRVSILKTRASSNQQITGIKLTDKVIPEFAYYYFVCNRYLFLKDLFQTTLPIINQKKICSVPFLLPSIETQEKILDFIKKIELIKLVEDLHLVDESTIGNNVKETAKNLFTLQFGQKALKTELNHQLALVKELRQAYLREAMQGKLVAQDERDEPAEILLEKIKTEKEKLVAEKRIWRDKPLPPINAEKIPFDIPSNWTWCRLIEISELKSGNQYKYTLSENGVMYVRVGDMNLEGNEYEIKTSSNYFERKEVKERDLIPLRSIIFPKRGGAIATNKRRVIAEEPILVDSNTMAVTPSPNINFNYFLHWFSTIDLSQSGNVNIIPQVNNKDLEPLIIPLPPLAEQKRIVARLEKLMKFCDELEANIRQGIKNADQLLQTALKEALESK